MEFTAVLSKFDSPLWGFHIKVPDAVTQYFLSSGNKRVLCSLNGEIPFPCALMPNGNGYHFININKEMRDKLKLKIGSEVTTVLQKDESKYGMPMPEEMDELLHQYPEGNHWFQSLTPVKQRSMLYIIGKPKGAETRLKKALVIIEHLKANQGKIDFRRLQEDMKGTNKM
ncbi:MAG: YdeI/OmpD-associated family protein [Saprospiraceae bacterium]